MAEVILRTKLFAPRSRPEFVDRPALVDRLRAGERGKLSLITGPAGFGKTSLTTRWLEETDRPGVWVSLDERDNDLIRFFTYLSAAVRQMQGAGRSSETLLETPPPDPLRALATALLNDCVSVDRPFIVVLDDYHVINQKVIHDAVSFLLDNLPPQVHLAVTSRTEPLLPLPRLRAAGHMTEIRTADLRFDRFETTTFLERMTGQELSDDQLVALDRRVEGWPAGLQMVAISILGRHEKSKISDLIEDFAASRRYIFDYLVDEVLDQLAPDVQTFLLQTSILERLNASLCNAVTNQVGGAEVLHDLEQRNLFIFPLADDRSWFRYHHLFAELLRRRLTRSQPDLIDELHLRASRWYEANDHPDDAVHHALEGNHDDRAARLSERYCTTWLGQSMLHKTRRCLERLPPDQIERRPQLAILDAWALVLTNQLDEAATRLDTAEQRLNEATTTPEIVDDWALSDPVADLARMEGELATCRAVVARANGDVAEMTGHLDRALEVLPDQAVAQRGTALLYRGFADWMAGDGESAQAGFDAAIEAGEAAGRPYTALSATTANGRLHLERGALREAEMYFRRAFVLAERHAERTGVIPPVVAEAHTGLAKLDLERNNLPSAREHLEQAMRGLEPLGVTEDWIDAGLLMASLLRAEGDPPAGDELVATINSAINHADTAAILRRRVKAHELDVQVRDPAVDRARLGDLVHRYLIADQGKTESITYIREEELLVLARWMIVEGDVRAAVDLLDRLDTSTRTAGRLDRLIRVLLTKALGLATQGDIDTVLPVVAEALELGEQAGYRRVFLNERDWLGDLLPLLPPTSVRERLLADMDHRGPTNRPTGRVAAPSSAGPGGELSERELEVLRLLSTHLSGPEIAGELYVSANTLKTHTRSIYRKLGVNKRSEAVAKAAAIDLI